MTKRRIVAEEFKTILRIADRALAIYEHHNGVLDGKARGIAKASIAGELLAVHQAVIPLRLDELLAADATNFLHDIAGIHRHIVMSEDLETAELTGCFMPRYAIVRH